MNEHEKRTVSRMICIYCRSQHSKDALCIDCRELEKYAHTRLDKCPFGEEKPACNKCTVHCYKPEYKEKIRSIMRFSGPRMLLHYPMDAIRHLWQTFF